MLAIFIYPVPGKLSNRTDFLRKKLKINSNDYLHEINIASTFASLFWKESVCEMDRSCPASWPDPENVQRTFFSRILWSGSSVG